MHACHLLHDICILSEERTGWNRWMRKWDKMYYWRKGPGVTNGCEHGAKYFIGRRDGV